MKNNRWKKIIGYIISYYPRNNRKATVAGGEGTQQREARKSDPGKPRAGQITKF